jgi:hypothetical protein
MLRTGEHGGVAGGTHNPLESTMRDTCREHLRTSLQVLRQIIPTPITTKRGKRKYSQMQQPVGRRGVAEEGYLGKT